MSINGLTFFEARKHVGSTGFLLYVHENREEPRERKDFETKEELFKYLHAFQLEFTDEQIILQLSGPPQEHSNPPGRKFIFTGRRNT